MTRLATEVRAAFQFLATHIAAANISQPTRLILKRLLATHTALLAQEWAFRAWVIILMAVVGDLRVAASLWSLAGISARRRNRAAGKWRLEDSPAAMTADLLKDSLPARSTRSFVAELFTNVVAALERSTTLTGADMLCFDSIIDGAVSSVQWTLLLLGRLALNSFALTRAATLLTSMSSAIKIRSAYSSTLRLLLMTLMADGGRSSPPATAVDCDVLQA